jgi:phosphatidylglycerol:prolipoprotein diacylglycerol transferase
MIPFLHIGRLAIPTFGLMVALAMVAAYFILRADFGRRGLGAGSSDGAGGLAEAFIALPCLAGIIGAKLYHVLETPRDLIADPLGEIFSQFGFAWFGGLIAGLAAFLWLARRQKIPLLEILDVGSPAAALGYGIGRIGCLLSGDGDYGVPTSLPWGMSFPNGLVPTDQRVHPTPIYELIAACFIAWILWRLGTLQTLADTIHAATSQAAVISAPLAPTRVSSWIPNVRLQMPSRYWSKLLRWLQPGAVFAAYLVLTGAARFLVEFIRINPRSFLGMSNAQAASLASMIGGAALWLWLRAKRNLGSASS